MSQKPEPLDTFLNVVFTQDYDRQKAYQAGKKVAIQNGVVFNGIVLTTIPSIPQPVLADMATFSVSDSKINVVFDAFVSEMELAKDKVRVQIAPVPAGFVLPAPKAPYS